MKIKVFDSELKIMEILWNEGDLTASRIVQLMKEQVGWSRTTTYTVIGKLIDKGAIERYGENFSCRATITKEQVQQFETTELLDKLFNGSAELFMSALISSKKISPDEAERMKLLVERLM
jgi:predicted transcriptional regulator